jgi:hypothetical protein
MISGDMAIFLVFLYSKKETRVTQQRYSTESSEAEKMDVSPRIVYGIVSRTS